MNPPTLTNAVAKPSAWHRVSSPAIARLVAVELLAQADQLSIPDDLKNVLQSKGGEDSDAHVSNRLAVWVNVEPLKVFADHQEEKRWQTTALHYCIRRQAHYPLLRRLFDTGKAEVTRLRLELGVVGPPVKNKRIQDHELVEIWRSWAQLKKTYVREVDQWITLAERFPNQPLSVLYQALITDASQVTT